MSTKGVGEQIEEEITSTVESTVIEVTITSTPTPTETTELLTEIQEEIRTPTVTTTPLPTPTPIVSRVVTVKIESPIFGEWEKNFWKETLDIRVPECKNPDCTLEEIENELNDFSGREWVTVQVGRIHYTHSGVHILHGPEFGELFRRAIESDEQIIVCFDEECYHSADSYTIKPNQLGEPLFLEDIFEMNDDDIFIFTCRNFDPAGRAPKYLLQLIKLYY